MLEVQPAPRRLRETAGEVLTARQALTAPALAVRAGLVALSL